MAVDLEVALNSINAQPADIQDLLRIALLKIVSNILHFTDMIYVSIFKEKAKEYKKILDLKATDKVRDTFYSENLDIIVAYEIGLAEAIEKEKASLGRVLTIKVVENIFDKFENMALWKH